MEFRVLGGFGGFGFRGFIGLGFRVWGLGFEVSASGFWGFGGLGLGLRVLGA